MRGALADSETLVQMSGPQGNVLLSVLLARRWVGWQCHVIQTVGIFPPFRGALEKCRAYVIVLICGSRGASASTLELALVSTSGPHPDFLFCPVCRFLSFLLRLLFTLHTLHLLQHKTTQHKIFFVIFMNNIYYVFFYFELEMILCLG